MTNSTDNTSQESKTDKKKKVKKPKGPIRTEAIIPVVIIIGLIYGYFALFFDSHLRKAIEFGGTMVHGAEVNIANIDSSFWGAYFKMHGLEVTDKEDPSRNLVQIDKIHFELVWDALLRAKFVVKESIIENIMAYSPRKSPGRIVPKEESKTKNEALQKVEETLVEESKAQFNENVLGDVANIVGGADPSAQLKQIQSDLQSEAKIKELEKALDEKKKVWEERINKLPQKPQIDALVARSKKLKFNTKNPAQFAKDVKEIDKIIKEGDKIVKEFNAAKKSLDSDVSGFNKDFKSIDELVKQDIKDLQTRLKIPSINVSDFSKGLFGRMISEKLGKYKKYMYMAREYMPPKKTAEEKAAAKTQNISPRERREGKNFKFPKAKAYPLFWLQHAKITSQESASEFSGNVSGEIKNATSQPILLGQPMTIDIKGDFPKQGILGFESNIIVDHTTNSPYEKIEAVIKEYPLAKQKLSDSDEVKLAIKNAKGQLKLKGISRDKKVQFAVDNSFNAVNYDISAKSNTVQEILTNITNDIPVITLKAKASGPWSGLSWKIKSNLGDELSKGFKKQLQAKIDEAKKKLNDFVNNKIKGERAKLDGKFKDIKGGIDKKVAGKKKELDKAKNQANNQLNSKKKSSKGGLKKEAKKAEKKLKKLLGF